MVQTRSFNLATYQKGDINAPKLALVLPGKLDTKDYADMHSHVDYLATKGYLAMSFDPPGTWESPGDIQLYTTTNYIKAANELIEHFGNRPTFMMGHSRGSSVATIVATNNPYVTAFTSVMCSLTPGLYRTASNESWRTRGYVVTMRDLPPGGGPEVKRFELPYAFFEDQKKYDLEDGLKNCRKPKLFILGKHDMTARPEGVRQLYKLSAGPKDLHVLDSDHDYRFNQDLINEVNQIVGQFLDTQLTVKRQLEQLL